MLTFIYMEWVQNRKLRCTDFLKEKRKKKPFKLKLKKKKKKKLDALKILNKQKTNQ